MIRYLKRNEIDTEKYDSCIEKSFNSRIYAYSWYLDIVADNWDILVLNDYEAVMPLPWRQKYFIKYIYPPAWTQQLGVFAIKETSEELILKFIKAIPRKFKKITIQFNSENKFNYKKLTERVNYILPLDKPYEEILKGFNNNRKRDLRKAQYFNEEINETISRDEFLQFFLKVEKKYNLLDNQVSTLKYLLNIEHVKINGVKENGELIAALVWLKDKNRITYLLPVSTKKSKEKGFPTLLVSNIIEKHQNCNLMLDFEGSMIKGVAAFYKSFGSRIENYFLYSKFTKGNYLNF